MDRNNLARTTENIAFVLAQIERESSYNEDPACPDLKKLFERTMVAYAEKYGIPESVMNTITTPGREFFDEIYKEY